MQQRTQNKIKWLGDCDARLDVSFSATGVLAQTALALCTHLESKPLDAHKQHLVLIPVPMRARNSNVKKLKVYAE